MTALPKHWPSSRRQGKRRAQQQKDQKLTKPVLCKKCKKPKRPGYSCSNCEK